MNYELPLVMVSNLNRLGTRLNKQYPNRIGLLLSPGGWADPLGLPYALDNGRFTVWSRGKKYDEAKFWKHLRRAQKIHAPLWLAVPDVVANRLATIDEYLHWAPKLTTLGWPLALVVQDGMTICDVQSLTPQPSVVFVGGTTKWKWRTIRHWCRNFTHVHVGRVNGYHSLWAAQYAGASSTDGTGWYYHKQLIALNKYLSRSSLGKRENDLPSLEILQRPFK